MAYTQIQQTNETLGHDLVPPSPPRPIPRTLQEELRNQLAAGNNQFRDPFADIHPVVGENVAMQGHPQDPHYIDVVHHDMPVLVGYDHHPQPGDPAVPYVYHDAGVAQDIPVQPQAMHVQAAPEIQGHNHFHVGYAPQLPVPGPARAEHPDPWAYNAPVGPVRDYPPVDNLRRLARRYLDNPNSQVNMVRMEPGHAGRFKVEITLETADFL